MCRLAGLVPLRVLCRACVTLAACSLSYAQTVPPVPATQPGAIKPRFELHVPSLHRLVSAARESNSAGLLAPVGDMLFELGSASSEGVDVEGVATILQQMRDWPDAAVQAVTYAADAEGRARWTIRFDWPLADLHTRVEQLLKSEAGVELFEGMNLTARPAGGYELALAESTVGFLLPVGRAGSLLASHAELEMPTEIFSGVPTEDAEPPLLLACRLNLKGTEQDSGALFAESFSAVTDVDYSVRVDESGDWLESINVNWPPISGMGAKLVLGKVSRTFFVPRQAFMAAAFSSMLVPGMLDGMVGFGAQVIMDSPGEMTIVGDAAPGPLARHADGEACFVLLPGTGFLPMPDVVMQVKAEGVETLTEDLRAATKKANKLLRDREQPEPWHEATVRDRTVFWSDGTTRVPGAIMPLLLRPVIFATSELDARDRERDYLVIAWTSTGPEDFVRRWLDLPRRENRLYVPQKRKTHGQMWINWGQVYRWVQPYLNLGLSAVVRDTLMPGFDEVAEDMTDGWVTVKAMYGGLRVSHRGPMPTGVIVVPALLGASLMEDESAGSDLARERLACRRLRVLYHHCKLFRKDMDRWPAEVAELQGYIDFAGNPKLLKLELSSKKRLTEWFEDVFSTSDEDEEDDEEREEFELDDSLYVIRWGAQSWKLGFAPGTFEHLADLYIDQDGKIHRRAADRPAGEQKQTQGRKDTTYK